MAESGNNSTHFSTTTDINRTTNISHLTSPLKSQYIVYNPMDNKLAHLLVTEHQYLQFIKILSTSRKNANRLLMDYGLESATRYNDYEDLLRSFSSDTTEVTKTEVATESEDDNSVLAHADKRTSEIDLLLENLDLNVSHDVMDGVIAEEDDDNDSEGITFDDLQKYEQLLNDFESTREEEMGNTLTPGQEQMDDQVDTKVLLEEITEDAGNDSVLTDANNSFTDYIRKKFRDEDSTNLISNPQEFLRKVSKIWKLMPKNLSKSSVASDINKDQFHDFFVKWKEQRKVIPEVDSNQSDDETKNTKRLKRQIQIDPDAPIPLEDITDELVEEKMGKLSYIEPSAPFEFFYNDKLKEILQDRGNFNLHKKDIRLRILSLWEKLSVLEKARYSSIVIDSQGSVPLPSPSKRSVSYNGSTPSSRIPSPKRSVSHFNTQRVDSALDAKSPATINSVLDFKIPPVITSTASGRSTVLTPPATPPVSAPALESPKRNLVQDHVRRLNKKKSWGKDDNWL